jgi:pilus assembly protein Flp/PilA
MLAVVPQLFVEAGRISAPSVSANPFNGPQNRWGDGQERLVRRTFFSLEILMLSIFRRLMKNEHGATAIEYTLIASLIAVAAIAAMRTVGTNVNAVLSNVAGAMT